jgi:hypothetical protein
MCLALLARQLGAHQCLWVAKLEAERPDSGQRVSAEKTFHQER